MIRKINRSAFSVAQCSKGGQSKGGQCAPNVRHQILAEAKGMTLREGVTYDSDGAHPWCKRRALHGRTNQVELVYDGEVIKTTGGTLLRNRLRWLRHP